MKRFVALLSALLMMLLTSGCWDNSELDEYGYVQAVGLDRKADGLFQVTTLFYQPVSRIDPSGDGAKLAQKGLTIVTSGETIMEAIRDIPNEFGRKAKFDHMRVIVFGEKLAQTENIREALDFFSRDHEPRGTVLPMVAKGEAGEYLSLQPFIEQTMGQQFKKMEQNGAHYSADTSDIPLYEFAIKLKSPSKTADLPYVHLGPSGERAVVSGVALIRDGKLAAILDDSETEALMLLTGRYVSGVIEFPCLRNGKDDAEGKDSFEVVSTESRVSQAVQGEKLSVRAQVLIEGTVGELRCSHLKTKQDVVRFEQKLKEKVEAQLVQAIGQFRRREVDALGIANQVYRKKPRLWKQLEPEWEKRWAQSEFQVGVTVRVLSTGMNVGTPFGTKEK